MSSVIVIALRHAPLRCATSPSVICKCKRREARDMVAPTHTPTPLAEVVRIACRHCETAAFAHEQVSLHHAKTAFAPHDSHVCATRKAHPAAFGNHAAGAGADTLQLQMTAGAETLTITNDSYSHAENAPVTLSHAGSRSPLRADPLRLAERRRAGMKKGGDKPSPAFPTQTICGR